MMVEFDARTEYLVLAFYGSLGVSTKLRFPAMHACCLTEVAGRFRHMWQTLVGIEIYLGCWSNMKDTIQELVLGGINHALDEGAALHLCVTLQQGVCS